MLDSVSVDTLSADTLVQVSGRKKMQSDNLYSGDHSDGVYVSPDKMQIQHGAVLYSAQTELQGDAA